MTAPENGLDPAAGVMNVRVPDRDANWGIPGAPAIVVRCVVIPRRCPACGGPRGNAHPVHIQDTPVNLSWDRWDNPCGHLDLFRDVIAEAAALTSGQVAA